MNRARFTEEKKRTSPADRFGVCARFLCRTVDRTIYLRVNVRNRCGTRSFFPKRFTNMLYDYARRFINGMKIIRARLSYVIRKNAHARESKKKKKIAAFTVCNKAARLYGRRVLLRTRAFKLKIAFENISLWRTTRIKNTLRQLDRVMRVVKRVFLSISLNSRSRFPEKSKRKYGQKQNYPCTKNKKIKCRENRLLESSGQG